MKILDILKSTECSKLFNEIQSFVYNFLHDYNDTIESYKNGIQSGDKEIFDFVWGTVSFCNYEICILDSPLLQRLRRIHQLGLVNTVYCDANSSRFSHTIGVTEVADRMVKIIDKRVNDKGAKIPNEDYNINEIVRLAAIFHDTGHMFFSHVSEIYYSYDKSFPRHEEVTAARAYFCKMTSSEVSLHELFSVMIVNSEETLRLFEILSLNMKSKLTGEEHIRKFAEYISCLIIGVPVDRFILPYSTIINSAIDADKLDYLSRDSACTRIPIAVDIARIIQKLDVVNIERIEFPKIWDELVKDGDKFYLMAIKNSAKKAFGQLWNARANMYDSVYYHHKVLTAEFMFRKVLKCIYEIDNEENKSFTSILGLTDDVFNEYWKTVLFSNMEIDCNKEEEISRLISKILKRDLYKRVASFSVGSFNENLVPAKKFFNQVIQDDYTYKHKKFCEVMCTEYEGILGSLKIDITEHEDIDFMFVYSKYEAMQTMPIESGDGYCIWSSSVMKQDTMEVGKKTKQEQFYLVSNCNNRKVAYLALEKVLFSFGIERISRDCSICLKIPYSDLNSYRIGLLESGYYSNSLPILSDDIVYSLLDKKMFEGVVEKFRTFEGVNSCKITKDSLFKFLRQFLWLEISYNDLKLLLNGIIKMLNDAYYIDRSSVNQEKVGENLSKLGYKIGCPIVALGGAKDSSSHLLYYLKDVFDVKSHLYNNIEDVLNSLPISDGCIYFFDDGAYSGGQVISIFQELMDIPLQERIISESHVTGLSEENKIKLKKCNIGLMYLVFNKQIEDKIKDELKKLGIEKVNIAFLHDMSEKIFDEGTSNSLEPEDKEVLKKYLNDIGYELLNSAKKQKNGEYKTNWDEERVRSSALGYEDAQQLVVFNYNIPTYSITAFWANGYFKGHEWKGLFQRTVND